MWKLLKTEIEYFRWLYILSFAFVIIVNFGLTVDGKWIEAHADFPGLRVIWLGIGIVVLFFAIGFNRKSKRIRTQMLIPLTRHQLATVRIMAFICFWSSLILILILFYIINFSSLPAQSWITNLLSVSGIMFLINSIPLLYTDFYSTYFKKREKAVMLMFWSILWVIYIFMNTVFLSYLDFISPEFFVAARTKLKDLYFTPGATLINVIIGLGMFFSSIITFARRKLYLE